MLRYNKSGRSGFPLFKEGGYFPSFYVEMRKRHSMRLFTKLFPKTNPLISKAIKHSACDNDFMA